MSTMMTRRRTMLLGVVSLLVAPWAVAGKDLLYCPSTSCVAEKLVDVDYKGGAKDRYECFNMVMRTSEEVTVLDSLSPNLEAQQAKLASSGLKQQLCSGLLESSSCMGRGTFNKQKRACDCTAGYHGLECANEVCPNNCNNQGYCLDNVCHCYQGWRGEGCDIQQCLDDCHNHGKCISGNCECYSGWTGTSCETQTCPNDCSYHGSCLLSTCYCDEGFTGEDCSEAVCPSNCYESLGHGYCANGKCACEASWTGPACEVAQCPNKCSGHGKCNNATGECECDDGFTGLDCTVSTCPNDCGEHGKCTGQQCECDEGYTSSSGPCVPACQYNCSGNGLCRAGIDGGHQCFCFKGYTGSVCQSTVCPNDCSGRGTCDPVNEVCVCASGFIGLDCSIALCLGGEKASEGLCSGNGYCEDTSLCQCFGGWKGSACNRRECKNVCSNHGMCNDNAECDCSSGWTGDDCSIETCPGDCNGNGICKTNPATGAPVCQCAEGYSGFDCSNKLCPKDCSGHGICKEGLCFCQSGWIGEACDTPPCGTCHGKGSCSGPDLLECSCKSGYRGTQCQIKNCPGFNSSLGECAGAGVCIGGKCHCNEGFSGEGCTDFCLSKNMAEYRVGLFCSGRGKCMPNKRCACEPGWSGQDCSVQTCPGACSGHGTCGDGGKCTCDDGWMGDACDDNGYGNDGTCDCSFNCTMQCLNHCQGVHSKYGILEAHQCFRSCSHACLYACSTLGYPTLEQYKPHERYVGAKVGTRYDVTATKLVGEQEAVKHADGEEQLLIQSESGATGGAERLVKKEVGVQAVIEEQDLPTMD